MDDQLIFLKGYTLGFWKCSRAIKIADFSKNDKLQLLNVLSVLSFCSLLSADRITFVYGPPFGDPCSNIWKYLNHFG